MIAPEALRITFFQTGTSDRFAPGWVHEKTVPYCILAQAVPGEYEVTCEGKTMRTGPREAFLTAPNHPLRIIHHADEQGRFVARWIHFSCVLHQTIDLGDLLEMPLRVAGAPARELGFLLDAFTKPPHGLEGAAAHHELAWRTVRFVCQISTLKPEAQDLLKAGRELEPLLRHLRGHLAERISVTHMAHFTGMSPSRLHAFFRERLHCSPGSYLKRLRLEAAAALLASTDAPLKQIAIQTGFANPFHLSREFKRRFALSPKAFRFLNVQNPGAIP